MHKSSKTIFIILFYLLKNTLLIAQEQLGLRLDNYSGVNAIALNPAGSATYLMGWDINLVGVGATFHNNLGYIEKASLGKAARDRKSVV